MLEHPVRADLLALAREPPEQYHRTRAFAVIVPDEVVRAGRAIPAVRATAFARDTPVSRVEGPPRRQRASR